MGRRLELPPGPRPGVSSGGTTQWVLSPQPHPCTEIFPGCTDLKPGVLTVCLKKSLEEGLCGRTWWLPAECVCVF